MPAVHCGTMDAWVWFKSRYRSHSSASSNLQALPASTGNTGPCSSSRVDALQENVGAGTPEGRDRLGSATGTSATEVLSLSSSSLIAKCNCSAGESGGTESARKADDGQCLGREAGKEAREEGSGIGEEGEEHGLGAYGGRAEGQEESIKKGLREEELRRGGKCQMIREEEEEQGLREERGLGKRAHGFVRERNLEFVEGKSLEFVEGKVAVFSGDSCISDGYPVGMRRNTLPGSPKGPTKGPTRNVHRSLHRLSISTPVPVKQKLTQPEV